MSDKSEFIIQKSTPVVQLDCTEAFKGLNQKEKLYAHYMSQASWYGSLAVLFQTSPESPLIFQLLHKVFQQPVSELKKVAIEECHFSEDNFQAFLIYACAFFSNFGNYKGFGDIKFVPDVEETKLETFLKATEAYKRESDLVQCIWNECRDGLYSLHDGCKQLGFADKGITTYFSKNCTKEDGDIVGNFLKSKKMEAYNSRVMKQVLDQKVTYEIRLASSLSDPDPTVTTGTTEFEGNQFTVTRGDHSEIMKLLVDNLKKAKEHAANVNQKEMLTHYINSFTTGSLDEHKDGSRFWVKDKGPVVECYIGFIESYRDPHGTRGEFEGFVSMVNKAMSAKFNELVNQAEKFLPCLPWPKDYEKDTFLRPDFTSLDVLTFSGSGVPAGICIPNYDELRQNEGFKNVSLGNVISSSMKDYKVEFLSAEDVKLMEEYRVRSFEVQVGLHELLGHGSGKQFTCSKDGTFNFNPDLKNLVTGEKICKWYEDGETFSSKFSSLASSYEECRAECVGLYLSLENNILKIFGFTGETAEDVKYVNWLSLLWNGMGKCLEMYQPKSETWLQAHSEARFVILRVLLETGDGLISVKQTVDKDGNDDLRLVLDRSKLDTSGKTAVGNFLKKLQVYKSTGDVEAATKFYKYYSTVNNEGPHPWLKWRDIVIAKKQPRKILVQANTFLTDNDVILKTYESSPEGMVASMAERFQDPTVYDILQKQYEKDKEHFV